MYWRQVGNLPPGGMLMLTQSDAKWLAEYLTEHEPQYHYEYRCHFMGYEGYDGGVTMYEKVPFADTYTRGRFVDWVPQKRAVELCKDRPIVPQADSWK